MVSPFFQIGQQSGQNLAKYQSNARDTSAIESILSEAMQSQDPSVLQNSIGKILSQVSPERQGMAVQYLQSSIQNIQQRKQEAAAQEAAKQAGYTYGAPPAVQAQQVKDAEKTKRLSQYGLVAPSTEIPAAPTMGAPQIPEVTSPINVPQSVFKKLSNDQLIVATGHPDKEVSEPAKAELKNRQEEEKIKVKQNSEVFKADLARSQKVLDTADQIAAQIPQKETALNLMDDAVANRNLGFFSPDNLAEITGIEGLRSQEGAIFKTAGKEYFLGNIARAGARPNQWIEQQIADMMAKIGRTSEANFSVIRALRNELDLDKKRVSLTNEISERLRSEGDLSQGKLGSEVNKELAAYAEKTQDILFNDLRAIKAIAEKEPQKFKKVEKGTKVSDYMAQALLLQFKNDPKKAAEEARKLGYEF